METVSKITQTQRELLELLELHPRGYRTKTAEGAKDLMALGMMGMACNIYEVADGFIGCITQAGRNQLNLYKPSN